MKVGWEGHGRRQEEREDNDDDDDEDDDDEDDDDYEMDEQIRKEETAFRKGSKRKRTQHECGVCEKSFSTASNLQTHMRIHTNEKPYECEACEMKFRQSSNFRRHMRTQH